MRAILTAAVLGLGLAAANGAGAEPMDAALAETMLFAPTGMIFYPVEPMGLDTDSMAKVGKLQDGMAGQMAAFEIGGYGYYGAFAVPMGQELTPESLVAIAGLHSPAAAQRAVLAQCKEALKTECTLVGLTLPAGYKKQPLTLSAAASAGLNESFGKGDGPHVLAYSPATAGFSVAKGAGEAAAAVALESCNAASAGVNDCVVGVVEN